MVALFSFRPRAAQVFAGEILWLWKSRRVWWESVVARLVTLLFVARFWAWQSTLQVSCKTVRQKCADVDAFCPKHNWPSRKQTTAQAVFRTQSVPVVIGLCTCVSVNLPVTKTNKKEEEGCFRRCWVNSLSRSVAAYSSALVGNNNKQVIGFCGGCGINQLHNCLAERQRKPLRSHKNARNVLYRQSSGT